MGKLALRAALWAWAWKEKYRRRREEEEEEEEKVMILLFTQYFLRTLGNTLFTLLGK